MTFKQYIQVQYRNDFRKVKQPCHKSMAYLLALDGNSFDFKAKYL